MLKLGNKTILILILVIAAVLRFFNYAEIPFTHDEFSALSRVYYDSFSDLIREGVMEDGHPAGIQVFLYYWVRFFGADEWIVKLPFTIFGLLSVWLVYKIACRWFNETTGLLSAAFFASIQFTVMYSQIARPYVSGLFFSLAMVHFWSKIMLEPGKHGFRNTILFVFFASLCTYNHHFSLLFAAIVGISGLFLVKKACRLRYLLSCMAIFLLYIPHLKIFFYQLHAGGVEGWLAKPHMDFFIDYPAYIFNFSVLSLLVTLAVVCIGLYGKNRQKPKLKYYLLFLSWFMLPVLTGFFYSRYVSAVLQFSVLIFSFTYLLFLLFGHLKPQKPLVNLLLVTAILCANTFSLVVTRDHYKLFYQSPYEALLIDYQEADPAGEHCLSIMDSHHRNTAYYSEKLGIDTAGFRWLDSFTNEHDLKCFLECQRKVYPKLYLGALSTINPRIVPLLRDYYPGLEWRRDYAGATSYLFTQGKEEDEYLVWKYKDSIAAPGRSEFRMEEEMEFGPTYTASLDDVDPGENDFIEISLRVESPGGNGGQYLVASLESHGKNIYWGSTPFDSFAPCEKDEDGWFRVHHVLKLSDIHLKYPDLLLKVYPWNRGGASFLLDDFKISVRPGNPVIYGLNESFRKQSKE